MVSAFGVLLPRPLQAFGRLYTRRATRHCRVHLRKVPVQPLSRPRIPVLAVPSFLQTSSRHLHPTFPPHLNRSQHLPPACSHYYHRSSSSSILPMWQTIPSVLALRLSHRSRLQIRTSLRRRARTLRLRSTRLPPLCLIPLPLQPCHHHLRLQCRANVRRMDIAHCPLPAFRRQSRHHIFQ